MKILITGGFGSGYSGDNSLLMKELKNYEFSSMDESIKTMYNWYESNKHIIEKEKL